ncbi:MAG: hypothetical protein RL768_1683, partial [Nitrospirota bacterium]
WGSVRLSKFVCGREVSVMGREAFMDEVQGITG